MGMGPNGRFWSGILAYQAGLDSFEPIPTENKCQETKDRARDIERMLEEFQRKHAYGMWNKNLRG